MRPRQQKIARIGLPIIGGMVSQNVLNVVDNLMVGSLGKGALDAVGQGGFASFFAAAAVMGLGTGVQAVAARRMGENRSSETALALNGGLLLSLIIGLPASIALVLLTPKFYPILFNADPHVVEAGVPYLQARLLSMVAVGMNYSFRGYWNGINRSHLYMKTLIVMHISNIAISAVLIFGLLGAPQLGTFGAGIGSATATYIGTAYYFSHGLRYARPGGFLRGLPSRQTLGSLLRLSVPTSIQTALFALGINVLFWISGRVPETTVSRDATTVLITLFLTVLLPGIGLGMTASSLVGQALGGNDEDDARQWGWDVCKTAVLVMFVLTMPMLIFPKFLLLPFLHKNPAALEAAIVPLRMIGFALWLEGIPRVLMHSLLGAGDNLRVMLVSISLQWTLFLPAAYFFGPKLGYGLTGIWAVHIVWSALQGFVYAFIWRSNVWTKHKL